MQLIYTFFFFFCQSKKGSVTALLFSLRILSRVCWHKSNRRVVPGPWRGSWEACILRHSAAMATTFLRWLHSLVMSSSALPGCWLCGRTTATGSKLNTWGVMGRQWGRESERRACDLENGQQVRDSELQNLTLAPGANFLDYWIRLYKDALCSQDDFMLTL